jgi:hypothetical protein
MACMEIFLPNGFLWKNPHSAQAFSQPFLHSPNVPSCKYKKYGSHIFGNRFVRQEEALRTYKPSSQALGESGIVL